MKQYCRYCIHLATGNGTWCGEQKKTMSDSTAKSVNKCKSFEFCEIDAFGETDGYKPRETPEHSLTGENQMTMFDGGLNENTYSSF